MLKIKDSVDLKELDKFGFEKKLLCYTKTIERNGFAVIHTKDIFIDELTRDISIQEGLFNVDMELNTIYDLIKADMIEKIEE